MTREYIEDKYCGLEIGDGWLPIVTPLFEYIEKYNADKKDIENFTKEDAEKGLSPKIEVHQCKEKFGELRFYTSGADSTLYSLIEQAENKSLETCELCGKPGKIRSKHHWLATLCDNCAKDLNYD